jgi:hypothetical protein
MGCRESRGNRRRSGIVGWRSAVSLSLGAAAILLLSAASASATWSHYFNLAQGDHVGYYLAPRVDVAPDGTAIFFWDRAGALQTRVRAPDGTLSPTQAIAPLPRSVE